MFKYKYISWWTAYKTDSDIFVYFRAIRTPNQLQQSALEFRAGVTTRAS